MNINKMLITAEREGSGAPECQRREIKSPRKLACRGFYFSRPIRKANTCLSAIRAHLGNPWLGSLQPRSARGLLKNYPEVQRNRVFHADCPCL